VEAEAKSREGRAAYDRGEFKQALELFREAHRLDPSERYLFNAAKACGRLKEWEGAIFFYEQYLAFKPTASDRAAVEKEIGLARKRLLKKGLSELRLRVTPERATVALEPGRETQATHAPCSFFVKPGTYTLKLAAPEHEPRELEVKVARQGKEVPEVHVVLKKKADIGWLELVCNEPRARVFIEGNYVGLTPLPSRSVRRGKYRMRIVKDGFETRNLEVEVRAGETSEVDVTLVAVAPQKKPEEPPHEESGFSWKYLFWAGGGLGLVTGAVGGYFWYDGVSRMTEADDRGVNDVLYRKDYKAGKRRLLAGQWLVGTGAGITATALVGLLLFPEQEPAALSVFPLDEGLLVNLSTSF